MWLAGQTGLWYAGSAFGNRWSVHGFQPTKLPVKSKKTLKKRISNIEK